MPFNIFFLRELLSALYLFDISQVMESVQRKKLPIRYVALLMLTRHFGLLWKIKNLTYPAKTMS